MDYIKNILIIIICNNYFTILESYSFQLIFYNRKTYLNENSISRLIDQTISSTIFQVVRRVVVEGLYFFDKNKLPC